MPSAKQVAKYFLITCDPDVGDNISNLKLQKLLYYAQGFYLALHDKPLFSDEIVAWEHGPVVESVYQEYRQYGANAIPSPENFTDSSFTNNQKELLKEVYEVYGQFSAWKLRQMTHAEKPWLDTPKNHIISHSKLKSFFKNYLVN